MSLWDGDTNLFDRERGDDPRNLGLTDLAYQFIGGLKKHAKAYIALSAPTVSSYKRLVTGAPTSGATWAPAYVTYGWNNRTMMLRIPEAGRIEDRTVDGSCNPYLAATAILAAGMDGIENEIDPGDPTSANMYEMSEEERRERGIEVLPANLLDATRELEGDEVLRKALGSVGDEDYVDYFIRCKRREWQTGARADHAVGARPLPAALLGRSCAMCGIAGLFSKSSSIEEELGAHLSAMLSQLADRGPDSAGVALYRDPAPAGACKVSLFSPEPAPPWHELAGELAEAFGGEAGPEVRASHALFVVPAAAAEVQRLAGAIATPSSG